MIDLRHRIAEEAQRMVGVSFAHHGRSARSGVDCVGLVYCVLERVGARVANFLDYSECPSPGRVLEQMRSRFDEIRSPGTGDIVTLRDGSGRAARHVGILVAPQMMVVSDTRKGVRRRTFVPTMMSAAFRVRGPQQ